MMQRRLMLTPCLFLMLGCPITINAQEKLLGQYRNYFGDHMPLNDDHTFTYTWHFHLQGSWTKGSWTRVGDTVFFNMTPVYDTLTKVLSPGQNLRAHPDKLLFRKGRLYYIFRRIIITKKQQRLWSNKKWPTYYFKSDD